MKATKTEGWFQAFEEKNIPWVRFFLEPVTWLWNRVEGISVEDGLPGWSKWLYNWAMVIVNPLRIGLFPFQILPKTNIALENRPSQKESSLPTIHF